MYTLKKSLIAFIGANPAVFLAPLLLPVLQMILFVQTAEGVTTAIQFENRPKRPSYLLDLFQIDEGKEEWVDEVMCSSTYMIRQNQYRYAIQ